MRKASAYDVCDDSDGSPAEGITSTSTKDEMRAQIAGGLVRLELFEQADRVIESIEDPFQFSHATIKLALGYHEHQREKEAEELFSQAFEIIKEERVSGEYGVRARDFLFAELALAYATSNHLV